MHKPYMDALMYYETTSASAYTVKPQGALNVLRLTQGKQDCWPKLTPAGVFKKKDLILADWWAESWDHLMLARVKGLLTDLLEEGFNIYLWQGSDLIRFDNPMSLGVTKTLKYRIGQGTDTLRKKISPEHKDVIFKRAMEQHKLPHDRLFVIQHRELLDLLGVPHNEQCHIQADYLLDTTHPLEKIRKVEALNPSFHTVGFDSAHSFYHSRKDREDTIIQRVAYFPDILQRDNYTRLELDLNRYIRIYLNWDQIPVFVRRLEEARGEKEEKIELVNPVSFLTLNLPSYDKSYPADIIHRLFTPQLHGLIIDSYPGQATAKEFKALSKITNLEYLELNGSAPVEIISSLIQASQHALKTLVIMSFGDVFLNEEMLNLNDEFVLSELNNLTVTDCKPEFLAYLLKKAPNLTSLSISFAKDMPSLSLVTTRLLKKLKSIEIHGECNIGLIESLLAVAINCEHLDTSHADIQGTFGASVRALNLRSFTLSHRNNALLRATPNLIKLIIKSPISQDVQVDNVNLPKLEELTVQGICLDAATLQPFILQSRLKTLSILDCDLICDMRFQGLLAYIEDISLTLRVSQLISITPNRDFPNIRKMKISPDRWDYDYSEREKSNIYHLLKSAKGLKILEVCDGRSSGLINTFDFMFNNLLLNSVETLILSNDCLRFDKDNFNTILIGILQNQPNLKVLTLSSSHHQGLEKIKSNRLLQDTLANINEVFLPVPNHYKNKVYRCNYITTAYKHALQLMNPIAAQQDDSQQAPSCDADTEEKPDAEFNLKRIFYATAGTAHPAPNHYRLAVYNALIFSAEKDPFVYQNKGDMEFIPANVDLVSDCEAIQQQGNYVGRQELRLTDAWHPIASLSVDDVMTHCHIASENPVVIGQQTAYPPVEQPMLNRMRAGFNWLFQTRQQPARALSADVEINYSQRDNLYYIRSLKGPRSIVLNFSLTSITRAVSHIENPDVQALIEQLRSFTSGKLMTGEVNSSPQAIVEAMMAQKVGACRHRAIAFKAMMETRHPEYPVRIINNDCHSFVEINQHDQWISCDLGGYAGKLNIAEYSFDPQDRKAMVRPNIVRKPIRYISEQERAFERAFDTGSKGYNPRANNPTLYIQQLLNGDHKKQLIHVGLEDMLALNMAIQRHAFHSSRPTWYIHSPDDLVCSSPFIQREGNHGVVCSQHNGGGPLHDFLTRLRDPAIEGSPILIINYTRFSPDDIVRFNGLLDEKRHADGTCLSEDTQVIGLQDPSRPGAYAGADFYSRFDHIEHCPLISLPAIESVLGLKVNKSNSSEPIVINLCHGSNWLTQLMGGWTLRHGALYFEDGAFTRPTWEQDGKWVSALECGRPILIQNPPNDSAFELFLQSARLHQRIDYNGLSYPFPADLSLISSEGYHWGRQLKQLTWLPMAPPTQDEIILNPSTLSDFLSQYLFDKDGLLTYQDGWMAHHVQITPVLPLKIVVTRSLKDDEWGIFFNELQKHPELAIEIACAPNVDLPEIMGILPATALLPSLDWDKNTLNATSVIVSNDADLTVFKIRQLHPDAIVLDISECQITDLVKSMNGCLKDSTFVFTEIEHALLTALNNNKRVILMGQFSDELLDGMAAFARARIADGQSSGQLIMVRERAVNFMPSLCHAVTWDEKVEALIAQGFTGHNIQVLEAEQDTPLQDETFISLLSRLQFKKNNPEQSSQATWDGLSSLSAPKSTLSFNIQTSQRDADEFMQQRVASFKHAIKNQPYVFLAGLTGVGKSRFVEQELGDRHIFHGEEAMAAWAGAASEEKPTLFIDEANLSTKLMSEFEGLFQEPPGILINGEYHVLSRQHQVVFAGNPLNYGDERKLSPLFYRHGNSLVFQPLSPAFIYERVIKPVLQDTFSDASMAIIAKELLSVYQFLVDISHKDVLITPRQIQMMALSVLEYEHRFPHVSIQEIAKFHARNIGSALIPELHREQFNQDFPEIERTSLLGEPDEKIQFNRFLATPSRARVLWQLSDVLHLRSYQRNINAQRSALRTGGLHRFVIEGEPGIGKSEIVVELLTSFGIHEACLTDSVQQQNAFYRLLPSMQFDVQQAILLRAFDEGAIVLIDEINSMPTLEKVLNSLLDGKHPKDNNRAPHHLGFRVFGTQNPPTMAGRRLASPALDNRTQTVYLDAYPEVEMDSILERMGMSSAVTRNELIAAFQTKACDAKIKHVTPAVFRDLIRVAKNCIEAQAKAAVYAPLPAMGVAVATWTDVFAERDNAPDDSLTNSM